MEMQLLMGCMSPVITAIVGLVSTLIGIRQRKVLFIGYGISIIMIACVVFAGFIIEHI